MNGRDQKWVLPESWEIWCLETGMSSEDITRVTIEFCNYWCEDTVADKYYDWFKIWQIWCTQGKEKAIAEKWIQGANKEPDRSEFLKEVERYFYKKKLKDCGIKTTEQGEELMNDNFEEIKMIDKNESILNLEEEIAKTIKRSSTTMTDTLLGLKYSPADQYLRLDALKIALEIAFKTCHFDQEYKSRDKFFDHLEQVYEIAERNLKFLLGEK